MSTETLPTPGVQHPPSQPGLALQTAPADMVDVTRLAPARQQQVAIIAASVQAHDSNTVATFGAGPQRKLSGFLDQLLTGTRADEIGLAGELMTELATDIKALDLPAVKREAEGKTALLARLPVVGKYYSAIRRLRAMQQTVVDQLAAIERRAETHLGKLKASNAGLNRLLRATEENLRELEAWVAGGQQALLRLRAQFEAERNTLAGVHDPWRLAKLRDMAEQIDAFETRLVRMHVAFTRGVLSIPQVRTAVQAGRIDMQNTLDTMLFDLPDLKAAIVRVAALHQIGIDALDQADTAAKRTQGDMGADVEILSRATDKMLATIEKGQQIDRENRTKREQAAQQLGEVRTRLMEGVRTAADGVRLS